MIKLQTSLFALVFLGLCSISRAAEQRYECPKEIRSEQRVSKDQIPAGWEVRHDFSPLPQVLKNVSVYDGVPDEGARLVPDNSSDKDPSKATWKVKKESKRTFWLACEYEGSALVFAREISDHVTTCWLLPPKIKSSQTHAGIACK